MYHGVRAAVFSFCSRKDDRHHTRNDLFKQNPMIWYKIASCLILGKYLKLFWSA
jgi:hypothetical protein